jgi:ATP-grasp domain
MIAGSHVLPSPRASRSAYTEALNHVIDAHRIDRIVPTCEEVFHIAAIRDSLHAPTTVEPLSRLAVLHDKWRFISACRDARLVTPVTYCVDTPDALRPLPPGEYILKPRYSRFATNVHVWRTGDTEPTIVWGQAQWIAQELLDGRPLCTWSVAHRGELLAHGAYTVRATAGIRGAATSFTSVSHPAAMRWVRHFIAHHALSGQFAFDFFESSRGLMAIECNPRLTSGVHLFRDLSVVSETLLRPDACHSQPTLEPASGISYRSALGMLACGNRVTPGRGLLDATDDPWPRRLQLFAWASLLTRAALRGTDPRKLSTIDIEWNGES